MRTRSAAGPSDTPAAVVAPPRSKRAAPAAPAAAAKKKKQKAATATKTVVERMLGISATELSQLIDAQRRIYEDQGWVDLSEEVCKGISRGRLNYLVMKHTMPV